MELNILPLLSTIANGNNLGVSALQCGNKDSLCAFDDAISRFRGALGEIRVAFYNKKGECGHARNNRADDFLSSSIPLFAAESQCDNPKREPTKHHSSIASRIPSSNLGRGQSSKKYRVKKPNTPSMSVHSASASSPRTECSFQLNQTRHGGCASSEIGQNASQLFLVQNDKKIGVVHEEPITIDLAEMRDTATSIMCFRILSTAERQHSSHKCGECILRECLINLSVIIVYNLGLTLHLKSRKQLAGCKSPQQVAINSRCLINSLRKAQVLYVAASRNMIRLPSLKYKLVLLNNMGQVYLDQNLPHHAKKCFEAVCRQATKSFYDRSGRNILIPQSSPNDANDDDSLAFVETKLMRSLMITATEGLLPDPHAAIA